MMKKLNFFTLFIFSIFLISCKGHVNNEEGKSNQEYSFEVDDSDESYDMTNWSEGKKQEYYSQVGKLIQYFLTNNGYKIPSKKEFTNKIDENFNLKVDFQKNYQIIPLKSTEDPHMPKEIVIFPNERIIAFDKELPLLDENSLRYYKSEDFRDLDHTYDNNLNLNKLLFSSEIDYKKSEVAISDLQKNNIKIVGQKVFVTSHDFNKDNFLDSILVFKNKLTTDKFEQEHFDLIIKVKLSNNKSQSEWINQNLVFSASENCVSQGFYNVVVKDTYFTIEQQTCYDYNVIVNSFTTFVVNLDTIYLHKYGEEYFDKSDHDKKIPTKIWTTKDFGKIEFEDVTDEFLLNLRSE